MAGRLAFWPFACLSLLLSCALRPASAADQPAATDYSTLCQWMTGAFSSQEQSEQNPEYFDIRLHMARIWDRRSDGYWLYVEQARADSLDSPYRQRVYQLIEHETGEFESRVFELPGDPLVFAGGWRDPARLASLRHEQLKLKEGCSIFLKRNPDGSFTGGTRGKGCASTLRGAAYTTSEVTLTADELRSWDRGFDADGKQVWGAVQGGYIFKRVKE